MENIIIGVIGLAIGVAAGRMTAPKAEPPAKVEGDGAEVAGLRRDLEAARSARATAEAELAALKAMPAAKPEAAPARAAAKAPDAELLAVENAALRKALASAEAKAARAALG